MELKVKVGSSDGRFIHSTVTAMYDHVDSVRSTISRRLMDTEDRMIREQLIKMGWTPPSEAEDEVPPDGRPSVCQYHNM